MQRRETLLGRRLRLEKDLRHLCHNLATLEETRDPDVVKGVWQDWHSKKRVPK